MLDIIIVTYNAKDKLKRCLKSIEKYTKGLSYLLTVVNNNSTDGTIQFLKTYQRKNENIKVINNSNNLGFSGGANIGLKNTCHKFVVLLDDDVEVTKNWLTGLYKQIKNKPKAGIVGAKITFPNNKIWCTGLTVWPFTIVGSHQDQIDKGQRDYIRECETLAGPCWLIRRALINKVGYFDERFFPSQHEDADYCLRTRLAGYKLIYNGKVKIIHHHLFRDGGKKQNRKNWRKFLRKWKGLLHRFPLKDSHPADKYIAKAMDYLKRKAFKQAIFEFKRAESVDKRFSEPFYLGLALEGMGKYNEAIRQFKRALNLNPNNVLAHYELGLIYRKLGLNKHAKQEVKPVIKYIHCNKDNLLRRA